jgi:hypothetical protein
MKKLLYILICSTVLFACKKSKSEVEPSIDINNIYGNWKYSASWVGAPGSQTKVTVNSTLEINRSGTIKSYLDGNLKSEDIFSIKKETSNEFSGLPSYVLVYDNGPFRRLVYAATSDSLVLAESGITTSHEIYTRIK